MSESTSQEKRSTRWCLESTADGGKSLERVPIQSLPFRVGRSEGLELTLPFQSVSKLHAELSIENDVLRLRDLSSTNGTFVNRKRVDEALLEEGDILHFAEFEFRLGRQPSDAEAFDDGHGGTLTLGKVDLPQQFIGGSRELSELIEQELTTAVFQPIVSLPAGTVVGYEALGRGRHQELPESPTALFRIAETTGREAALSRLFRKTAAEVARDQARALPLVFLNTHPSELGAPELVQSLHEVRAIVPDLKIALEIHEGALAAPGVIAELKKHLDELEMQLALDDFGVGERFLQIAEVPPHYIKFDISIIKSLAEAPSSKKRLLSMFMAAAREIGAEPIAEGIETEKEAGDCTMMGFSLGQGYLYSKPVPLAGIVPACDDTLEQPAQKIHEDGEDDGK